MKVIVIKPFVGTVGGQTFNMPAAGTLLDVSDDVAHTLMGMGVVNEYGMKVDPVPPVVKKKSGLSESSQAVLVPPQRTRRKWRDLLKRSSL